MFTNDSKIRYNSYTDWVQVYHESTWKNWKLGGMNVDPTKMELSQDEFVAICGAGLQSMMSVGAIIHMNNYYCGDYEVIDVNHDGTLNTVDVMAHTQVYKMMFNGGASGKNYNTSAIRTWINSTYIDAFDYEIRELIKIQQVAYYNNSSTMYLQDKAKLLSWMELNINIGTIDEGSAYPVFTRGAAGTADAKRWRNAGSYGDNAVYYLRSLYSTGIAGIKNTCVMETLGEGNNIGILPVLRF